MTRYIVFAALWMIVGVLGLWWLRASPPSPSPAEETGVYGQVPADGTMDGLTFTTKDNKPERWSFVGGGSVGLKKGDLIAVKDNGDGRLKVTITALDGRQTILWAAPQADGH